MKFERVITVEGNPVTVILSDETETLLAAQAAGRVAVGLALPGRTADLSPVQYVYEPSGIPEPDRTPELPDDAWLERAARRSLGLPWQIAHTGRLIIREFKETDFDRLAEEPEDGPAERLFRSRDAFAAYIRSQYCFYECGMWAVERRSDGVLVGLAGVTPAGIAGSVPHPDTEAVLELGYHIFSPFRRQGYAEEACRSILSWVQEEYGGQTEIFAYTSPENTASERLLKKLGFVPVGTAVQMRTAQANCWRLECAACAVTGR